MNFEETLSDDESVKIIEDSLEADMQSDCDDVKSDDDDVNDDKSFFNSNLDKENIILVIKLIINHKLKFKISYLFKKKTRL